jgi:hypothetical protein
MLEIARPETAKVAARSHPDASKWGSVDAIFALVMLPFGVGLIVIESIVRFAAWLFEIDLRQ